MIAATTAATEEHALTHLRAGLADPTATFREGQWEIIDRLVNQRGRVLAVQATGWGKSMVYFVATKLLREHGFGTTIIVSPLLALMRNQRTAAERLGLRTIAWTSENKDQWPIFEKELLAGEVDILLVSPERLARQDFRDDVLSHLLQQQTMFVVDEAHCISEWGHDFRPDYQRIRGLVRSMPPGVPVLGTTATANDRVVEDVVEQFGAGTTVVRGSLVRHSLQLQTMPTAGKARRLAWLAQHLDELPGSGIIYVLTKRDAEQVAGFLERRGHAVRPYYSRGSYDETPREDDEQLEQMLLDGELKALVATTKLGMGFDKPDLGFVVHYQLPASVIAYYQQIGRAGRAIDNAVCVVMTGDEDWKINEFFVKNAVPEQRHMELVLHAIEQHDDGATPGQIQRATDLPTRKIQHVLVHLHALDPSPVLREGSTWRRTHVPLRYEHDLIEARKERKRLEFATMAELASADGAGCMMSPILRALDDHSAPDICGRCERCVGAPIISPDVDDAMLAAVQHELQYLDMPIHPRKMWPNGFGEAHDVKGRISAEELAEAGRVLCTWGDPGIGELARQSKESGVLGSKVRDEFARLASERWQFDAKPGWVTWVPSRTRDALGRALAQAVAEARGLPLITPLRRVEDRPPQKAKQTSWHQAANVLGAFEVDQAQVPGGQPGILVDDAVDSRWTFTVLSRQLRMAGAGAVYPMAMVDTSRTDGSE